MRARSHGNGADQPAVSLANDPTSGQCRCDRLRGPRGVISTSTFLSCADKGLGPCRSSTTGRQCGMTDEFPRWLSTEEAVFKVALWLLRQDVRTTKTGAAARRM